MDKQLHLKGTLVAEFKGENGPQSPAGLYATDTNDPLAIRSFKHVGGSDLSYNNYCDLDRLLQTMTHLRAVMGDHFEYRIALGAKHGNCCGAGLGEDSASAIARMLTGDVRAIFGGVVLLNTPVTENDARLLLHHESHGASRLLSVIAAPSFTPAAFRIFEKERPKTALLENEALYKLTSESLEKAPRVRHVRGGYLMQPNYTYVPDFTRLTTGSTADVSFQEESDLKIAWAIGATSNSNTITLVRMGQLIGNGVGQQDRVGAAELAVKRARDAGHKLKGAVAYSDSFFPFPDGPITLVKNGVKTILATSGSIRDKEVQDAVAAAGGTLLTLPDSEARGFFGH